MDITPAVQMGDAASLSAEEFQQQLCTWLDSRGMLMELRAYLKSNMIEILRNTSSGTSMRLKSNVRLSPKMQALNCLISEYLAHCKYHFSLSVFATEVSLTNNIAKDKDFKFSEEEVYDILEALGIMRHNKQAMCIYFMYKEGNEPLLNYFLPSPPVFSGNREEVEGFYTILDGEFDFAIHNITKILVNSNLLPEEINQLKYYVKWIAEKHKEREQQLESTLRIEFKLQLSKYKVKIHDMEKAHHLERKILEAKLEEVKDKLVILCKKEEEENAKLKERNAAEAEAKRLKENQKESRTKLEKSCTNPNVNKTKSKEAVRSSVAKVDVAVSTDVIRETKGLQCNPDDCDAEKLRKQLDVDKEAVKSFSLENDVLKQTVKHLEFENETLRTDNFGFSRQLEDLAKRATNLMTELNISQRNMLRLSGVLNPDSEGHCVPLAAVNPQQILSYTGAGEEFIRTSNVIPPQYRHLCRPSRSKKQNLRSSSPSCSSRSASPTESVLQHARERLKNLEEESKAIERSIQSTNIQKPNSNVPSTTELGVAASGSSISETTESSIIDFCNGSTNITSRVNMLTTTTPTRVPA